MGAEAKRVETVKPAKKHSPMAYNKATIRRRITSTAERFRRSRIEEIEKALDQALQCMYSEGLLPFSRSDLSLMKFTVSFDAGGTVVTLPERLKFWLNEI